MQKILIAVPAAFDEKDTALYLGTVAKQIQEGYQSGHIDRDMWWEFA